MPFESYYSTETDSAREIGWVDVRDNVLHIHPEDHDKKGAVGRDASIRIALQIIPKCGTCPHFEQKSDGMTAWCGHPDVDNLMPHDGSGFCHHHPESNETTPATS